MARNNLDIEDVPPIVLFIVVSGITAGILQLTAYGSFTLSDTAIQGLEVSIAWFIQLASLASVFITNQLSLGDVNPLQPNASGGLSSTSRYLFGGMVVAIFAMEFIPAANDFVTSSDMVGTAVVLIEAAGIMSLSWLQ